MSERTLKAQVRKLQDSGGRLFDELVERGREVEQRGKESLRQARERVESSVESLREGAGEQFDRRLSGVLRRLGVPARDEIRTLTRRIERLTRQVEALGWDEREIYHVLPHPEGWQVTLEGAAEPASVHPTKDEALATARALARRREPSQVVVHKQDGSVQMQYAYGGTAA